MDPERRAEADSLTEALRERPFEFDFFQAVRRLECANPGLPRIGHSQRSQDEPVRFSQNVSLAFAPASIHAYYEADDEHPARMMVNFFGLLGTNGPMPLHVTEYIHDRENNYKDQTLARFLDIFNHRMISKFYRAWACNQQTVSHDRKHEDRFAFYIGSLFGIGPDSFRNRDALPDIAKIHYSGRLSCQTRNAEGLQQILRDYTGIRAEIKQFVGQWINLPQEYHCRFGGSRENAIVGSTLVVGSRIFDCQQKFGIRLGPMSFSDYQRMLPGGDSIGRLKAWVRNYTGDEFSWELNLVLQRAEIPRVCLGKTGQLGWSTWLGSREFKKDADDLVLRNLTA
jgi:type VI secretion system protein ImpH